MTQWCVKRRYHEEDVPGLGRVRIQSITSEEFVKIANAGPGMETVVALIYCMVDENNDRIYVDNDATKHRLKSLDFAILQRLANIINPFCLAADVETEKKSYEGTASDDS